jgi:hypothetical protein
MAATATAKLRDRAERLEKAVIGMGFLLEKLRAQFGSEFGVGTAQQVNQAIAQYHQFKASALARRAAADANTETAARSG